MLLATCCEDDIVPHVLPFITGNIKNQNWRYREAAPVKKYLKFEGHTTLLSYGPLFWKSSSKFNSFINS